MFKFIALEVTSKKTYHLPSSAEHMPSLLFWPVFQVRAILVTVLKAGSGEKAKGKIQVPFSLWAKLNFGKQNLSIRKEDE